MSPEDFAFLGNLYRALQDRPLDPWDAAYVGLYERGRIPGLEDPVELLARRILWARRAATGPNTSAQLLSGFRGSGKSTELRRLRRDLREQGYLVLLVDVFDYLNPSSPIDISEFAMVLAGALSDALEDEDVLPRDAAHESYWSRLKRFLQTRAEFEEVVASIGAVGIKASLRTDPTFRERLRRRVEGHLPDLIADMRQYVTETVTAIPEDRYGEGLVLIVDSLERIALTLSNSEEVQSSLERLFTSHAATLHLPQVHALYTVPPWLNIRVPGISSQFSAGLQMLHPLTVRRPDAGREPVQATLDALCEVVGARGDWKRVLGDRETLDRLALMSGGNLRDLLRILSEIVLRADRLPVPEETIQQAFDQARSELRRITLDEVRWLQRIAETRDASLPDITRLPRLVTFLDSRLVLCYRNGEAWYDVHPLVREEVRRGVAEHPSPGADEPLLDP